MTDRQDNYESRRRKHLAYMDDKRKEAANRAASGDAAVTDPTPARDAPDLVGRATDLFLDGINSDAGCQATYPAVHEAARAVVALVLEEAAQIIEQNSEWVRSTDNSRNIQPRTDGDRLGLGYAAAIRALILEQKGGRDG